MNPAFDNLAKEFVQEFGRPHQFVARAPGRVNLIGEHTDYNRGLVLPMAIDRKIEIWFAPREDSTVNLYSKNFDQRASFSLTEPLEKDSRSSWADYVKGVAEVLRKDLNIGFGFDGVIVGDIPVASGLSSSAAIEVASVLAFYQLADRELPPAVAIAKLAQQAERDFVGVNCGLMDQFISVAAVEGTALKIDCDTMEFAQIIFPKSLAIVVADTKLSRSLAGSAYNQRRQECEQALIMIQTKFADGESINSMKDVTLAVAMASESFLPSNLFKRVRHVATETKRVEQAAIALQDGDLRTLGELFDASHASLRDDYEVSSEGLDKITATMRSVVGCYGARLTGAGFGGCAIAAVDDSVVDEFISQLRKTTAANDPKPEFFRTRPAKGAEIISA